MCPRVLPRTLPSTPRGHILPKIIEFRLQNGSPESDFLLILGSLGLDVPQGAFSWVAPPAFLLQEQCFSSRIPPPGFPLQGSSSSLSFFPAFLFSFFPSAHHPFLPSFLLPFSPSFLFVFPYTFFTFFCSSSLLSFLPSYVWTVCGCGLGIHLEIVWVLFGYSMDDSWFRDFSCLGQG